MDLVKENKNFQRLDYINDELHIITRLLCKPQACQAAPEIMDCIRMSLERVHSLSSQLAYEMRSKEIKRSPNSAFAARKEAPVSDLDIDRIVEQACNERPFQWLDRGQTDRMEVKEIARRAAELAVAKERERCLHANFLLGAKRGAPQNDMDRGYLQANSDIAAAIRAGKEVGSE